jgi:hypothetical protein
MMPGFNVQCTSAQACPRSQVCCANLALGGGGINVVCAASCGTGFQVCATDAECGRGQACGPAPVGGGMICQMVGTPGAPPPDAGTPNAGRDAGRPEAGVAVIEAGVVEAGVVEAGVVEAGVVDAAHAQEAGPDASLVEAGVAEAAAAAEASANAEDAASGDDADEASADP